MLSSAEIITWIFVAGNTGRLLAYLPQIVAAWKCENGAKSVSRFTWSYFALAHLTGVLYASLVVNDTRMAIVFFGNLMACVSLVAIVTWKDLCHRAGSGQAESIHGKPMRNPWESYPDLGKRHAMRRQM
jgi:hypothetical protein